MLLARCIKWNQEVLLHRGCAGVGRWVFLVLTVLAGVWFDAGERNTRPAFDNTVIPRLTNDPAKEFFG